MTEQFAELAAALVRGKQLPESTTVVVPGNPEFVSVEKLEALTEQAFADIIKTLARTS